MNVELKKIFVSMTYVMFTVTFYLGMLCVMAIIVSTIPGAQALDEFPGESGACINTTHLRQNIEWKNDSGGDCIICASNVVSCPYGCDLVKQSCNKWPGNAMPGEYFLLFEAIALGLVLFILYRMDVPQGSIRAFDVFLPVLTIILLSSLSLQGNNVIDMTSGEAMQLTMVVWFDYGFMVILLIPFFLNLFKYIGGAVNG